jgi:hypothetical protein
VVIDTVVRGDSIDAAMVSRPPEHSAECVAYPIGRRR